MKLKDSKFNDTVSVYTLHGKHIWRENEYNTGCCWRFSHYQVLFKNYLL